MLAPRSAATGEAADPWRDIALDQIVSHISRDGELASVFHVFDAKTKARIGKQPMMYEGPYFESIDIDTPADWDFAVVAARFMQEQQKAAQ